MSCPIVVAGTFFLLGSVVAAAEVAYLRPGEVVVCVGDSVTAAGVYDSFLQAMLDRMYPEAGIRIVNRGQGGQTASAAVNLLRSAIDTEHPTLATFMFGVNDTRWSAGDEEADMPKLIADYDTASRQAFAMAGPQFMGLFDLAAEPAGLRESYGGEFGQRLLLSRRLVEGGVRFIEVSHNLGFVNGTGWDTHNEGQLKQHLLIEELDKGLATLVTDLEAKKLLDKTVIAVATEFGRPAQFDSGGGRGHHAKCFSMVLAGGGLKTGRAIGTSDELGMSPVTDPISIPDFHATIHSALGTNPAEELYDGARPVPLTDGGTVITSLL